jgi:hypothetical protein
MDKIDAIRRRTEYLFIAIACITLISVIVNGVVVDNIANNVMLRCGIQINVLARSLLLNAFPIANIFLVAWLMDVISDLKSAVAKQACKKSHGGR